MSSLRIPVQRADASDGVNFSNIEMAEALAIQQLINRLIFAVPIEIEEATADPPHSIIGRANATDHALADFVASTYAAVAIAAEDLAGDHPGVKGKSPFRAADVARAFPVTPSVPRRPDGPQDEPPEMRFGNFQHPLHH